MKYLTIFTCLMMTACTQNEKIADTRSQSTDVKAGNVMFSTGMNLAPNTYRQIPTQSQSWQMQRQTCSAIPKV